MTATQRENESKRAYRAHNIYIYVYDCHQGGLLRNFTDMRACIRCRFGRACMYVCAEIVLTTNVCMNIIDKFIVHKSPIHMHIKK